MSSKIYAGIPVNVTDDGYLTDPQCWTKEMAIEIAREEGIPDLTEKHLAILIYLRNRYLSGDSLTIRSIGKSGVADIKDFYQLFPGAPLKKATRIAGVPKPFSCI